MNETRCLTTEQLLTEAWQYWRAARAAQDVAGEAVWGEALDALLDRLRP
jgi:hypothetical protein